MILIVKRIAAWPGTRYEKLAVNFLAMAKLAMIRRYFSVLELSDRP